MRGNRSKQAGSRLVSYEPGTSPGGKSRAGSSAFELLLLVAGLLVGLLGCPPASVRAVEQAAFVSRSPAVQEECARGFGWAVFGTDRVHVESGVVVDSFDSTVGPYSSAAARERSRVGSNGSVVLEAGAHVRGEVIDAAGVILFPPIEVPEIPDDGVLELGVDAVLTAGDYHYSSLFVAPGVTLTVLGPARIVLDSAVFQPASTWIIDTEHGPVDIYATGDFDLRENSIIETLNGCAQDITLEITSTNLGEDPRMIILDSDGAFVGTIYAPRARVEIDNEFVLHGAIKARETFIEAGAAVHYDETLSGEADRSAPNLQETTE